MLSQPAETVTLWVGIPCDRISNIHQFVKVTAMESDEPPPMEFDTSEFLKIICLNPLLGRLSDYFSGSIIREEQDVANAIRYEENQDDAVPMSVMPSPKYSGETKERKPYERGPLEDEYGKVG